MAEGSSGPYRREDALIRFRPIAVDPSTPVAVSAEGDGGATRPAPARAGHPHPARGHPGLGEGGAPPSVPAEVIGRFERRGAVPEPPLRLAGGLEQERPRNQAGAVALGAVGPGGPAQVPVAGGTATEGRGGLGGDPGRGIARSPGAAPAPAGGARAPYQDALLNTFRLGAAPVEVLCLGGRVVLGTLVNFDTYSLILQTADGPTLVFKHAVVTVRAVGRGQPMAPP